MKIRVNAIRTIVVAMVLIAPAAAFAKNSRTTRKADVLSTLKTGQWIRLEGVLMKDRTVQCTELKVLAGDFLDDDSGVTGRIESVDVPARRLMIGNIAIQVAENAVLEGPRGPYKTLAQIRPGMIVEVDGTYLNETFLAKDVDDESDEISFPPGERQLCVIGKIEQTEPARRRLHVMGTVFTLTDKTQVKSVIR